MANRNKKIILGSVATCVVLPQGDIKPTFNTVEKEICIKCEYIQAESYSCDSCGRKW